MEETDRSMISAREVYIEHKHSTGLFHALGVSPEEARYKLLKERMRTAIYNSPRDIRLDKLTETLGRIDMKILAYGFKFVPAHYVSSLLDQLENTIQTIETLEIP